MLDRSNYRLNAIIERYIDTWDGTFIGMEVKNMYENGTSYEVICDYAGIDYEDYKDQIFKAEQWAFVLFFGGKYV